MVLIDSDVVSFSLGNNVYSICVFTLKDTQKARPDKHVQGDLPSGMQVSASCTGLTPLPFPVNSIYCLFSSLYRCVS